MGYKTELHCHSGVVSACGRLSPERIVERYLEHGYSTVVITDHLSRYTFEAGNYGGKDDWDEKVDFFLTSITIITITMPAMRNACTITSCVTRSINACRVAVSVLMRLMTAPVEVLS